MLLDKVKELNDRLYQMCGELHKNKDFVGDYQDEVLSRIFELYKFDYEIIKLGLIEERVKRDELEERNELVTPKRRRVWYAPWRKKCNAAAELLDREAALNIKQYFDRRAKALDELEELIKQAEEGTTAEAMQEPTEEEPETPTEDEQEQQAEPSDDEQE